MALGNLKTGMRGDLSRRRLLGLVGLSTMGTAGCLGDGGEDEGSHPEPETYPPGLAADGPEIDTLHATIAETLQSGTAQYKGLAQHRDIGDESAEGEGLRVAVDYPAQRGFVIHGQSPVQVTDPLEAVEVEMWYVEGEEGYAVEDFGEPEPIEHTFETLTDRIADHRMAVGDVTAAIEWGAPRWNRGLAVYEIPGTTFEGTDPTVSKATLSVNPNGIPVGLRGSVERAPGPSTVEITLLPDPTVDRPTWVAEAF